MMGAVDLFKTALGDFPPGDISNNTLAAKALIKAGLAVILIEPNGKKPLCILNSAQVKRADVEAQEAARDAGSTNWQSVRHDCGRKHAITDLAVLNRKRVKDLLAAGANLAVVLGEGSTPVIAVDLDTREEGRAFMAAWSAEAGEEILEPMTVASPGVMRTEVGGEEVWDHKDGGHFWFTLPDGVELPDRPGKYRGEGGWTAYYRAAYVLVPPSVRPEGPYRLTGAALEAPGWLIERIQAGAQADVSQTLQEHLDAGPGDIDGWASAVSWEEILTADGWTVTGRADTCGCPTFTRPGSPVHAKSATGHEAGCVMYDTSTGHGPLHIWSDAVDIGGRKTVSKLTYLATERFGGNVGAALESVGLDASAVAPELGIFDPWTEEETAPKGREGENVVPDKIVDSWARVDLSQYVDGTYSRPVATLFPRSDGECLIYPGLIHSFHGESESCKSLILMGEAVRLMKAGQNVLWVSFDSDAAEDVSRAMRMGCTPEDILAHLDYRRPDSPPGPGAEGYRDMFVHPDGTNKQGQYALAVIDGVTDAINLLAGGAAKGDPNDLYVQFARILPRRLADKTGAAVVLIDHVAKDAESRGRFAIGAQAKMSQLTGAAYVVEPAEDAPQIDGKGTVILRVGKDRPGTVRRASGPRRAKDRTQEAARVIVDDTGPWTVVTVEPPAVQDPFATEDRPVDIMAAISRFLEDKPEGMSGRSIETAVSGNAARIRLALELLINEGFVLKTEGGRGRATLHSLSRPFLEPGVDDVAA